MWKRSIQVVAIVIVAAALSAEGGPRLTLGWLDHHELVPDFQQVRAAADEAFVELGVDARWEIGTDPRPSSSDEFRIHVVLMPSEPTSFCLPPDAMGVVLLPERQTRREFVYLFYASVLRGLGLDDASSMHSVRERRDIARAIGRVIVHEVIHAVVPDLAHDDRGDGIMQERLTAHALSKRRLRVDERTRRAFLIGLGLEQEPEPTTTTASAK